MNIPTMTNEQFALWITAQTSRTFTFAQATEFYNWLESKAKKADKPITPKGK